MGVVGLGGLGCFDLLFEFIYFAVYFYFDFVGVCLF